MTCLKLSQQPSLGLVRRERDSELVQHCRRGFEKLVPWPEHHPKQLQRLMLARNLALMNFLHECPRRGDPCPDPRLPGPDGRKT